VSLIEKINADFMSAYKLSKNDESKRLEKNFIGVIKGEVTRETKEPTDQQIISKLKSMIKKNSESIEQTGVSSLTEMEVKILNSYLPIQMSDSEIEFKVDELISSGADNIGRVMSGFKGLEADMKIVKELTTKKLNLI